MRSAPAAGAALLAAAGLAAALVASCTVPSEEAASPIDPADLPDQLRTDITTTTTTSPPESPIAVPITLYVIAPLGERHVVAPIQREIRPNADLFARLSLLFVSDLLQEHQGESEYQNALVSLEMLSAEVLDNGVAVIDIASYDVDGEVIALDNDALRDAAAQLVFSATSFEDVERVRLLYNGERVNLPTQGAQGDTDRLLTTADYPLYDPATEIETLDAIPDDDPEPEPAEAEPAAPSPTLTTVPGDPPDSDDSDDDDS